MAEFRVKCIGRTTAYLILGTVYRARFDEGDREAGKIRIWSTSLKVWLDYANYPDRFERMSPETPTKEEPMDHWNEYSFNIRSKDAIDYEKVREDLTAKEPMMILEIPGSPLVKVLLHHSIWEKARACGPKFQDYYMGRPFPWDEYFYEDQLEKYLDSYNEHSEGWMHRRFLPGLIRLVKEIKHAKWEKPLKATVTVKRVKI